MKTKRMRICVIGNDDGSIIEDCAYEIASDIEAELSDKKLLCWREDDIVSESRAADLVKKRIAECNRTIRRLLYFKTSTIIREV